MTKKSRGRQRHQAAARAARRARLQWWGVIGAGVTIVGGVLAWSIIASLPEDGVTSSRGWDLPIIDNDPDGDGRLTLAELEGRPVVANFYADWCTACESELPGFAAVSAEFRDEVTFVGINSQESGSRTRLPREFGVDWWPLARDINGSQGGGSGLWESLGGTGMPITAFYRADGTLARVASFLSESNLRAIISEEFGIS